MPPVVTAAAPHELPPALRVLFGPDRDPEADRCRDALAEPGGDPAAVFVARAGGRVCGAVLVQALPGALGVAWPPRAETAAEAAALAAAAVGWLRDRGVKVCQAFAPPADAPDLTPLERVGFRRVTDLVSMSREAEPFPPDLSGSYYLPACRDRFAAALLATHHGTLDCPELTGDRTAADLVAGFALPDHPWAGCWLATAAGADVGASVVEPSADREALDLSYLGVVPAARGRGHGDRLLRRVLSDASAGGFRSVTLSVDARNTPAVRLYRRHGFAETDRRGVWLMHL